MPGPFTGFFSSPPISDVYNWVREFYTKVTWTKSKVEDIYYWYLNAINKGVPYFQGVPAQNKQLFAYMKDNTGLAFSDILGFLDAVKTLATTGKIDNKWWTGRVPKQAVEEAEKAKNMVPGVGIFKDSLRAVKWVSIAGIVGIGLYFTWPLLVKGRGKIKRA